MISDNRYSAIISSPLGKIGFIVEEEQLTKLELLSDEHEFKSADDTFSKQIANELNSYFENPKHAFKIKNKIKGTPFQLKVWEALQNIPSGEALTYGELAKQLQTGPRAIGQACRTNPIPVIVPCHRVVAGTHLGGYSGAKYGKFTDIKKWLLKHEGFSAA